MSDIRLVVSEDAAVIGLSVETEQTVQIAISDSQGTLPPIYDGGTTVIPSADIDQILPTKNHVLKDDITVQKIQYEEVSNIAGGYTASIAS